MNGKKWFQTQVLKKAYVNHAKDIILRKIKLFKKVRLNGLHRFRCKKQFHIHCSIYKKNPTKEIFEKIKILELEIERLSNSFEETYDELLYLDVSEEEIENNMYYNYDEYFK